MLSENNPNDDELECRSMRYLHALNELRDRTVQDHLTLLRSWNPSEDTCVGLMIMLSELLDESFNDSRFDINLEVRQEFIKSLENADDELQILRRKEYEEARLKAIQSKEEDERQVRLHELEIKAATVDIENLQREIDDDERANAANPDEYEKAELHVASPVSGKWRLLKDSVQEASVSKQPHSFARVAEKIIQQKRDLLQNKKRNWNGTDSLYFSLRSALPTRLQEMAAITNY